MSEAVVMRATLDAADRLVAADEGLGAINARAGGHSGAALAVPELAALVRLARRLGVEIARAATIADDEADLDCWITATPGEGGTVLEVSVLRERSAWRTPVAAMGPVPAPPGARWTWEVDAALRVVRIDEEAGIDPATALGAPLTRLFALAPTAQGAMPILDAMAAQQNFDGQPATLAGRDEALSLAGSVRRNARGGFAGFVGGVFAAPVEVAPAPPPIGVTGQFNARLERVLRGPLGRIIANADSIHAGADGPLDPHYADYAADIASAGRHLLGLVDDLVDLEAIERDDFAVEAETIDLADVARRAAGLLSVRAADAGVTIDRTDTQRPLPAVGEFRRTLQIMVNLIGNAVRYSPRGGTVWLRLQQEGDRAVAIVADQGRGIAVADQARVFEKFERIDPSEPGGSGLGLYIARRLARAMGGDLTVDSAPGAGARFVLSLPAAM
jgi:signal transduction histidine kinase